MKRLLVLLACLLAVTAQGQILSIIMGGTNQPAATPTFSPVAGAVTNPTTVTASTSTSDGCTIYFDTSNPPVTAQTTYSVTTGVTLYAQARGCAHHRDSLVGSAAYTISAGCTAIPYTDNFTPTGALNSSCWTQTTGTPSNIANCTQNSGFAIVASGKQCLAMFTGYAYGLTTSQSIQTALTWTASNYSGIGIMTIAGNGVAWFPRIGAVYAIVNGVGMGSVGGCSTGTSGDVIKFAVTGIVSGNGTVTVTDVTTSTTLCTLPGTPLGGGGSQQYPTIFVDETTATGTKAGPATMN